MHRILRLRWTGPAVALLTLGLLGASGTAPLRAQQSTTRGLNLGFYLEAASLSVEGSEGESGGGAGFRVGYGLNRIFSLYFEADGVSVESQNAERFQGTWTLGHADLGTRIHFANSLRSWVPYLDVAVGGRWASVKDVEVNGQSGGDVSISGGSFSFGGGLSAYLKETLALDVGLKFSTGEFNEIRIGALSINNLDVDAKSARFRVGLVWWP